MTPAQLLFWRRVQARAALEMPETAARILKAFQVLRDSLSDSQLTRILADPYGVEIITQQILSDQVLDRVFAPVQARLQATTADGMAYFAKGLPSGGIVGGATLGVFNVLNPDVVTALQTLNTKVIQTLKDDVRETVRQAIRTGLEAGDAPKTVARGLRQVIGLAPNQAQAVENFRAQLESGDLAALQRKLRDRRFDGTLRKALGSDGTGLSPAQIDKMVASYRTRMIAHNAETNARTAMLDAFKAGQHLSWQTAVDNGLVDGSKLTKRWVGVLDDRERPEHVAMEGETVPYDEPYSNGNMIPGDDTWNCRCLSVYTVAPSRAPLYDVTESP